MAFGKKTSNDDKLAPQAPSSNDEPKKSDELAEPTVAENGQTVDPDKDKVLPESKPEELAPVPDAATGKPTKTVESSSTGYRVAEGKSVIGKTGELLDSGAEIGEQHFEGGRERLDALVQSGHVVKTGGSSSTGSGESSPVNKPNDDKPPFSP